MAAASPTFIFEILSKQLGLLRNLADSLEQAQVAPATTTPANLDQCSVRQLELCRQLRALATGLPDEPYLRAYAGLANDLQETAVRVAELNRKYAALLRRRRRTVDIFCRVLMNSGETYPPPKMLSRPDSDALRPKG